MSCPCQPFSAAGKGEGFADERHLWPAAYHLVSQCRPERIVGEQVASKDTNPWLDLVQVDLEALGYAFGCVPFPSAGVGAPHIRDRAYWCAGVTQGDTGGTGLERFSSGHSAQGGWQGAVRPVATAGESGRLANTPSNGFIGGWPRRAIEEGRQPQPSATGQLPDGLEGRGIDGGLADTRRAHHRSQINTANHGQPQADRPANQPCGCGGASCGVADTDSELRDGRGQCGQGWRVEHSIGCTACRVANMHSDGCAARGEIRPVCQKSNAEHGGATCGLDNTISIGRGASRDGNHTGDDGQQLDANGSNDRPGSVNGHWSAADWLHCRDGKWRSVESGTFPLAHGMPRSMGALPPELRGLAELAGLFGDSLKRAKNYRTSSLKGYGNAINAEVAKVFIECLFHPSNRHPDQWTWA